MGLKVDEEYLNNLRFADGMILLSNSGLNLKGMMTDHHAESRKVCLKLTMKKSKIVYKNQLVGREVMIGNEALEIVEEYPCPGQAVKRNPFHEKEIRIGLGWSAFCNHSSTTNISLPLFLRRSVYNE